MIHDVYNLDIDDIYAKMVELLPRAKYGQGPFGNGDMYRELIEEQLQGLFDHVNDVITNEDDE